jgi:hypothetical protein
MATPEQTWVAILVALPKAKLSDADLTMVKELSAKTLALLVEARKDGKRLNDEVQ